MFHGARWLQTEQSHRTQQPERVLLLAFVRAQPLGQRVQPIATDPLAVAIKALIGSPKFSGRLASRAAITIPASEEAGSLALDARLEGRKALF